MGRSPIIHIIDDDESLRLSLDSLLRSVGHQTRLYPSATEFLASPRSDVPGCLLVDIRLPGISGLDFQDRLVERGILLPVILITGHADVPMSVRGMKAGAVDFLLKPVREQDVLDAVSRALLRDETRRTADASGAEIRRKFGALSAREKEVMALVCAGRMNKEVAAYLGLSEITVKIHRSSAMRKMAAKTFADLVRMANALHLES